MCNQSGMKDCTKPVQYSNNELEAMKEVYANLITEKQVDPNRIGLRALAIITLIYKLRVEEASCKYNNLLKFLKTYNLESLKTTDDKVEGLFEKEEIKEILDVYQSCGRDLENRSILWIMSPCREYSPDMEKDFCLVALLHWLAIHADNVTIREGVTIVVDLSPKTTKNTYGNETKLRYLHQSFPFRPQNVMLAGASIFLIYIMNGLMRILSLFMNYKIVDQIRFVTMEDAVNSISLRSAPKYVGGGGGEIDDMHKWIKDRVLALPIPVL